MQLFFGMMTFFISVFFFGVTMLVRSFPIIVDLLTRVLRILLSISYKAYRHLLKVLNPYFRSIINHSLLVNPIRTIATTSLSFLICFVLCSICHWRVTLLFLGAFGLHGILIGLGWQDFFEPNGIHVGEQLW